MICSSCGVNYASFAVSNACQLCEDERQFVPAGRQKWLTLSEVSESRSIRIEERRAGLFELWCEPNFGIGQRMFFVKTVHDNILWDLIPFVDDGVLAFFAEHGGVDGVAISHPHFYSTMKVWHEELEAPVYTHAADQQWLGERFKGQVLWSEEKRNLTPQASLIRCGGHFEGSTILHVLPQEGAPYILSGDTIFPVLDRAHVTFMRSFPNAIPLGPNRLKQIDAAMKGLEFEQIYGAFTGHEILQDGRQVYEKSMARYLNYIHDVL